MHGVRVGKLCWWYNGASLGLSTLRCAPRTYNASQPPRVINSATSILQHHGQALSPRNTPIVRENIHIWRRLQLHACAIRGTRLSVVENGYRQVPAELRAVAMLLTNPAGRERRAELLNERLRGAQYVFLILR